MSLSTDSILGLSKPSSASQKTLVLSIHTNYPAFLDLQLRLSKKNLKFDYDFVVGWDEPESPDKSLGLSDSRFIAENLTLSLGATFHRIPRWVHTERNRLFFRSDLRKFSPLDPAIRCSNTLNYMLGLLPWQTYKQILVLDSDMFPIKEVKISPVDELRPIAGVRQLSGRQKKYEYFWNGIVWIHGRAPFSHLINFDIVKSTSVRTDVGGATNQYIQLCRHLGLEPVFLGHLSSLNWTIRDLTELELPEPLKERILSDYRNENGFYSEIYEGSFLHYRGGGNWMNRDPGVEIHNRSLLLSALESSF